jgi:hypothetical protein
VVKIAGRSKVLFWHLFFNRERFSVVAKLRAEERVSATTLAKSTRRSAMMPFSFL